MNEQELSFCREIQKTHSKTYFYATSLFPKELREATQVMYAFFRVVDEVVDNPAPGTSEVEIATQLDHLFSLWKQAYAGKHVNHVVFRCAAEVFHRFRVPFSYSESFFDAMIQDVHVTRYRTYADLEQYMDGSAAAVGLIMASIVGFSHSKALSHASALGYAMQLANFLRDVGDDISARGRIYLPQEDMKLHGVFETDIIAHRQSDRMTSLLAMYIERADNLFEYAKQGIHYLHPRGRTAVIAGTALYQEILREIERNEYDVFSTRASTSGKTKMKVVARAVRSRKEYSYA